MHRRIFHLDSLTIDKVAAGEVIDVPASCIKELVENAVDAGADDILIELQLGGRELIRVTDNGSGMCREDVLSSIERHTTSKISSIDDLEKLSSMGFRGEALASIVAISRVRITSGEKDGEHQIVNATTLCAEGGEVLSITDTKASYGTSIEVSSLFYNVPARRKFLKSPAKDTTDAIKMVTLLALASPHVGFRCIADGQNVLSVQKASSFTHRCKAVLGGAFASSAFEINYATEGLALTGVIASPQHAKTTRTGQYLFVNNRPVVSFPLSYTIRNAFGSACDQNKHPLFCLSLHLDPSTIDVNIHPQKKEVRFSDEEWVKTHVYESVSKALFGSAFVEKMPQIQEAPPVSYEEKKYASEVFAFSVPQKKQEEAFLPFSLQEKKVMVEDVPLAVIGELLLVKQKEEILVLDIRCAMKAILYKELRSQKKDCVEGLLIPVRIECSQQEAALFTHHQELFESWGFIVRPFGPSCFLVEGVPSYMKGINVERFLKEAIHEPELISNKETCSLCRVVGLSVAAMDSLKIPISLDVACTVFSRWNACDRPSVAPDGSVCAVCIDEVMLRKNFF